MRSEAEALGIDVPASMRRPSGQSKPPTPPPPQPTAEHEEPDTPRDSDASQTPRPEEPPQASGPFGAEEDRRSVKELLEECRRRGLDTSGCKFREDLLNLLKQPAAPPQEQPKPATSSSSTAGAVPPPRPSAASAPKVTPLVWPRPNPATPNFTTQQAKDSTVWDRRNVPQRYGTRKNTALWLLGFDPALPMPSSSDLRSAYRKAALESHPDRSQNHVRQEEAKQLFQAVKDAFDLLSPLAPR